MPPSTKRRSADRHRVVDAGDRTGGGDGIGEVGSRGIDAAKGGAAAGLVVAGHDPQVRVGTPAAGDDATDRLLERLGREDAAPQPAAEDSCRRVAARVDESAKRKLPGAGTDRRPGALQLESRPGGTVGRCRRASLGVADAVERLSTRVGDHEPGWDAGGAKRADHRAGRGSDHIVRLRWVPTRLLGERVQPAGEPCTSLDPAGTEDETDLHPCRIGAFMRDGRNHRSLQATVNPLPGSGADRGPQLVARDGRVDWDLAAQCAEYQLGNATSLREGECPIQSAPFHAKQNYCFSSKRRFALTPTVQRLRGHLSCR